MQHWDGFWGKLAGYLCLVVAGGGSSMPLAERSAGGCEGHLLEAGTLKVRRNIEASNFQTDKGELDYLTDFAMTAFSARMRQWIYGEAPGPWSIPSTIAQHHPHLLRWLNLGAGKAIAELDVLSRYYRAGGRFPTIEILSLGYEAPSDNAYLEALTFFRSQLGPRVLRYLETKTYPRAEVPDFPKSEQGMFFAVPSEEIGFQDLITDQRGVLNFVSRYSENLTKTLSLLYPGGDLVMTHPADPGFFVIEDPDGKPIPIVDFFRSIRGVQLIHFHHLGLLVDRITGEPFSLFVIGLRRTEEALWVPAVDSIFIGDESPPRRVFRLRSHLPKPLTS